MWGIMNLIIPIPRRTYPTKWIWPECFLNYLQSTYPHQNGSKNQARNPIITTTDQPNRKPGILSQSPPPPLFFTSNSNQGENSEFSAKREPPTPKFGNIIPPSSVLGSGLHFLTEFNPRDRHCLRSSILNPLLSSCRKFHRMAAVLSPTGLMGSLSIASSKSPSSSMMNLAGEGGDDIAALSAGFDRRRTLRRKLSTASDPTDSNDKPLEKLIPVVKHRESISEDEEVPASFDEKAKDLKVQDVLAQLDKVISYRGRNVSHIVVEEAVKELCAAYDCLEEAEKLTFLKTLASTYGVDHDSIRKLATSLVDCSDENGQLNIQEKLRTALVPKYQWLFSQIGRLEGGVKFLVDFRTDLVEISQKYSDSSLHLKTMNNALRDKIEMWFAVGFLNLERVTWNSPCDMLQKISEYEAVHPMRNWTDLKRRVGNYRRCYVYTHGSMPGEPLHTALTDHIPSSIAYIVTNSRMRQMSVDSNADLGSRATEDAGSITTAIFYSITSTQKGLAGIELGNYLIKRVVKELQKEFPKMGVFSSLSPIPGFRSWFLSELKAAQKTPHVPKLITPDELKKFSGLLECDPDENEVLSRIHCLISHNDWAEDRTLVDALENILMRHCARYLVMVKRRGFALNSVANFHLKNGAEVWRLNWKANLKPRGLSESCGIMVNYRYFLDYCERNSQNYMERQLVRTSDQMKHLLRSFLIEASPPLSPQK